MVDGGKSGERRRGSGRSDEMGSWLDRREGGEVKGWEVRFWAREKAQMDLWGLID